MSSLPRTLLALGGGAESDGGVLTPPPHRGSSTWQPGKGLRHARRVTQVGNVCVNQLLLLCNYILGGIRVGFLNYTGI